MKVRTDELGSHMPAACPGCGQGSTLTACVYCASWWCYASGHVRHVCQALRREALERGLCAVDDSTAAKLEEEEDL